MASAGIGDRLEGIHAVAAGLEAGRLVELWVEHSRTSSVAIATLTDRAEATGVPVHVVDDVRPMAATTAPQGVVATARPIPVRSLDDLLALTRPPAVLVLDHVEDPRNVGAITRSMVAAGVSGLVVARSRAAPLGATAFKAAAGALEHVAVAEVASIAEVLVACRRRDVWSLGLDAAGDDSLLGHPLLVEPVALVVGAEGRGLSRLVRDRVDAVVRLPLRGPVESLNVAAAATLAVFEVARARGWLVS